MKKILAHFYLEGSLGERESQLVSAESPFEYPEKGDWMLQVKGRPFIFACGSYWTKQGR